MEEVGTRTRGARALLGQVMFCRGQSLGLSGIDSVGVRLWARSFVWEFIIVDIGTDEGILGNDFAMRYALTVCPHKGADYLPNAGQLGKDGLGDDWSVCSGPSQGYGW